MQQCQRQWLEQLAIQKSVGAKIATVVTILEHEYYLGLT